MSLATAARPTAAGSRTALDRVLAAMPLLTVFAWFALVYAWQAWLVRSPFIFTDELEFTQLARSIAETGEATRRGQAYGLPRLPSVLTAPAWLIADVHAAYFTAKLIGVLAMTAAVFPAYALARMLVSPRAALFAAAATIAIPAFMYSSILMQEPFAYTASLLGLFLIVRALARPGRWSIGLAVAATLAAPFVRSQLAVLAAVFLAAALVLAWSSEPVRRRRAGWTRWDYAGAITLATGAAVLFNELMSHRSFSWLVATRHYKDRMVDLGAAAGGAFTIGIGVLPVLVGLAILLRPRDEPRTPELRAFLVVLAASVLAFGFYGAVKATYLSTLHGTYVYERNLIYLAPLFFVATALWLEGARIRIVALALSSLAVALLLAHTPVILEYPYFEAPGYSLLTFANRSLSLPGATIEALLPLVLGIAVALVAATMLLRRRPLARGAVAVAAAALVLAWNVGGQLNISAGARASADFLLSAYPEPHDWVDRATGGEPVTFLGQGISNSNPIWLLEFWNRSIRHVWSIDGTARGPGPTLTPDLGDVDGTLAPDLGVPYVVADASIDIAGELVAEQGGLRLLRVDQPLRLRQAQSGISTDGWMSRKAAYSQFSTANGKAGTILVSVGRLGCGEGVDPPGNVTIRVGPLGVGPDRQAAITSVTRSVDWVVRCGLAETFPIPSPPPPFRVEIEVDPPFVPAQVDARQTDQRELGAQVGFSFVPSGS